MPHHHDVYGGPGALVVRGIDDEFAIHAPHAHSGNRGIERNVREGQCSGRGIDSDHIRIVLLIGGEYQRNDLRLVAETIREHGPDGAVDLPRGQDFLLAGPAFALDKAAGDASAGIGVFTVIDSEREEIDAFPRVGGGYRGCQDDRLASTDERRA